MDKEDVELRDRVARLEEKLNAEIENRKKLDSVVEDMRDIVSEIRYMRVDLKKIDEKVNTIEQKPAKRWEGLITGLIGAITGGVGVIIVSLLTGGAG